MLRLYHFALSPFSRKVRLCLAEKKIEVELIEEKYWERSADFLHRNPAGGRRAGPAARLERHHAHRRRRLGAGDVDR